MPYFCICVCSYAQFSVNLNEKSMFLLNTTFQVDDAISADFVGFLRGEYIPVACSECGFTQPLLTRVLGSTDSGGAGSSTTYALQMRAPSRRILDEFLTGRGPRLLGLVSDRWGVRVPYFTSILEIVK